jgi:hypothetical protein
VERAHPKAGPLDRMVRLSRYTVRIGGFSLVLQIVQPTVERLVEKSESE